MDANHASSIHKKAPARKPGPDLQNRNQNFYKAALRAATAAKNRSICSICA
jgi:hypothetical protein